MYNRYIPQADGTFRRNRVPDKTPPAPPHPSPPHCKQEEPPEPSRQTPPMVHGTQHQNRSCSQRRRPPHSAPKEDTSVTGFLRRLLPKEFDTGDLIIVLLLLLMAGDCVEEQNNALLTLALYFFM